MFLDLHKGILKEFAERVVRFNGSVAKDAGLVFRRPRSEDRQTQKSRIAFRTVARLCHKCGKPTQDGTLCDEHKITHAASERARFAKRKQDGICKSCPNHVSVGIRCDECKSKRAESRKRLAIGSMRTGTE